MLKSTSRTNPLRHFLWLVTYQRDPNQGNRRSRSQLPIRYHLTHISNAIPGYHHARDLPSLRYIGLEYELRLTTANLIFSKFLPFRPVLFSKRFLVSENGSP